MLLLVNYIYFAALTLRFSNKIRLRNIPFSVLSAFTLNNTLYCGMLEINDQTWKRSTIYLSSFINHH